MLSGFRTSTRRMNLIVRTCVLGAGTGALVYGTLSTSTTAEAPWSLTESLGIVRVARTALTVVQICWDYQSQLRWGWGLSAENRRHLRDGSLSPDLYYDLASRVHTRSAQRLLQLCSDNGGCYIKVGQHLATLDYLVPPEYIDVLKVLHSSAPQSPINYLMNVVRTELGTEPNEVIAEFDPEPLGTASLAQVHKCRLRDGSTIALKIQHPRVRQQSTHDIRTMELFVRLVAWAFPSFKLLWLAEVTKENLPRELDFVQEAHNAERVAAMFSHRPWLKVPAVRWDLTTSRLLAMEYCDGVQVTDTVHLHRQGVSPRELSQLLGSLYAEMIFGKGYIHCDPHPGNLLIKKSGGQTQVSLLDHGLYLTLPDRVRLGYSRLWLSILAGDVQAIKHEADELGAGTMHGLLACMVSGRSWRAITGGLHTQRLNAQEENEVKHEIARYLPEISEVLNQVPRELLLIFKTNDLLRGIDYKLGTKGSMTAFFTMSEWCTRAVYGEMYNRAGSRMSRALVTTRLYWSLLKIQVYKMFIMVATSRLASSLSQLTRGLTTSKLAS